MVGAILVAVFPNYRQIIDTDVVVQWLQPLL